jgi:hypothetical protein
MFESRLYAAQLAALQSDDDRMSGVDNPAYACEMEMVALDTVAVMADSNITRLAHLHIGDTHA